MKITSRIVINLDLKFKSKLITILEVRDLASQKFLPAETLVDHGARRAKNEKKIIRVARGAQNDKNN